jgi:serine/threonine protein kinase
VAARAVDEPAATPGLVIDDRYQLDQVRAEHQPQPSLRTVLWRATDRSLDRPVAIRLINGLGKRSHKALVDAAARASQVSDARFVRVLDIGTLELGHATTSWLATEWVDAPTLSATVRGEPLAPEVATSVVRDCAEALAAAAESGCSHRRLHPDQILLPTAGVPRITGLETAAALHGPDGTTDDLRGLGGLLFAALTGRWPLPGWTGLPAVDNRVAAAARPRLVRAGIPRELDEITHAMLVGGYPDPRTCARALTALPSRRPGERPETNEQLGPGMLSRWAWRLVPPLVVLAIGIGGWAVGSDLGRVPTSAREPRAAQPATRASAPGIGAATLVWRHPPAATGFDPEGDGQENNDQALLAVDHDPTTSWMTDLYRNSSHLGGLKSGVGLLLDLGHKSSVSVVELALTEAGADLEVRAGNVVPSQAADLPLVASQKDAAIRTKLDVAPAVKARYWLVWFTNLPKDGSGYRVGVAEVALLG